MTNTRIVFISILIAILLAVLVLWCADVLAHSDGNPAAHFEPYTAEDPCWDRSCRADPEYRNGHGHIDDYDDDNGNGRWDVGEENSWGYWTCGGYKYLEPETDCSGPEPEPEPEPAPPPAPPPPPPPPAPRQQTQSEQPRSFLSDSTSESTSTKELKEEEIVETVVMCSYFDYGLWHQGRNLVSLPHILPDWETISDFYDYYDQGDYKSFMSGSTISVYIDGEWLSYNGQDGQEAGDVELTPYLGMLVERDFTVLWGMPGSMKITGDGEVELSPGVNVVGLTELPSRYERPSDFLEIDGIESVQVTKWSDESNLSVLLTIEQAGDEGDDPLYLGQAVILVSTIETTLDMTERMPSAPQARQVRMTTSWGKLKNGR